MSKLRQAAASTSDVAALATEAALAAGANAVEAALSGWLALGGATSWALLAPVTLAVGGAGAGGAFVDGRARQPGKGLVRPLRYASDADVPAIARVSVPATGAVLAAAAALFGVRSSHVASAGAKAAKKARSTARATLLARLGAAPQRALSETSFAAELLAAAPRIDGAMIGAEDLDDIDVEVRHRPDWEAISGRTVATPQWADPLAPRGRTEAIVAVDAQGAVAAICLDAPQATFSLFDGELELPLAAAGLRKGLPRVKPGAPLASPCAVALVRGDDGSTHALVSLDGPIDGRALDALDLGSASARAAVGGFVTATRSAYARVT